MGEDRAVGVYADYYTFGASLFNFVGNSRDGPARPGAYDHHVHVVVEGPEDLLRRPVVVGQRVADIVVLEITDLLIILEIKDLLVVLEITDLLVVLGIKDFLVVLIIKDLL